MRRYNGQSRSAFSLVGHHFVALTKTKSDIPAPRSAGKSKTSDINTPLVSDRISAPLIVLGMMIAYFLNLPIGLTIMFVPVFFLWACVSLRKFLRHRVTESDR